MGLWKLGDIRRRVREITGRFSPTEISNDLLTQYINQYYQLIFPQQVKLDFMETYYEFTTLPYKGTYPQPLDKYVNFLPPAYCNNNPLVVSQNIQNFNSGMNNKYIYQTPFVGDGETLSYSWDVGSLPISPNTLVISNGIETIIDTNEYWTNERVSLMSDAGPAGNIHYPTGQINFSFTQPTPINEPIKVSFATFLVGIPRNLTMFNNNFYLNPVPNHVYKIKIQAYQGLPALLNTNDEPLMEEWGLCICYGAAKEILASYSEIEGYQQVSMLHKEQLSLVVRRTQLNANVRIPYSYL